MLFFFNYLLQDTGLIAAVLEISSRLAVDCQVNLEKNVRSVPVMIVKRSV